MHLDLTEEQTMLRDMCRQFAREELLPKAGEIDERAEFPKEQVGRMAELGLLGVAVPTEYDGAGMDNVSYALAMEEISATSTMHSFLSASLHCMRSPNSQSSFIESAPGYDFQFMYPLIIPQILEIPNKN